MVSIPPAETPRSNRNNAINAMIEKAKNRPNDDNSSVRSQGNAAITPNGSSLTNTSANNIAAAQASISTASRQN